MTKPCGSLHWQVVEHIGAEVAQAQALMAAVLDFELMEQVPPLHLATPLLLRTGMAVPTM